MRLTSLLVALHYPDSSSLLKAATELAHKSGALLKAYYLENREWFEASKISFSSQVSGFKGEILPLTEKQILRESQALSERLRKMFVTYGEQFQIKYTYRLVRGSDDQELLSAAAEVDLAMIKRNNRILGRKSSLGPVVRNLITNIETPLLIWNESSGQWPKLTITLCETVRESSGLLRWSLELADLLDQSVYFFWPDDVDIQSEEFEQSIAEEGLRGYMHLIREQSVHYPSSAFEYLKHRQKALVVLRRKEDIATVTNLIDSLPNSILLV